METKIQENKVYISREANGALVSYLDTFGFDVELFGPIDTVAEPISCHPDLVYTWLKPGEIFVGVAGRLGSKYPDDVKFNACSTGKYFIHNLSYTDDELKTRAEELGLITVDVKQGYTRCNVLTVDENSIITSDAGVAKACEAYGLSVLLITPGFIQLPSYNTGFIGGTAGRVGNRIVFNGDLSSHPDYLNILDFIEARGLECIFFEDYPLTDIGSIVALNR